MYCVLHRSVHEYDTKQQPPSTNTHPPFLTNSSSSPVSGSASPRRRTQGNEADVKSWLITSPGNGTKDAASAASTHSGCTDHKLTYQRTKR